MSNTCILTKQLPFEGSGSIQLIFNNLLFLAIRPYLFIFASVIEKTE